MFDLHPAFAILEWIIGGAGIGITTPRLSTAVIAYSAPEAQGAEGSALNVNNALSTSVARALTDILAPHLSSDDSVFAGVFALVTLAACARVICAGLTVRS